ncbi:MAG TPA: hypothetical protein VF834_20715 [Streptosporangiaceae bacterium]
MNQGREPGHDDYGLPRVDIQIPDDARELYRDVQAYHRELRARRRQARSMRWRGPLRRSGVVIPLIAGCLVLAMIAGMVLTMFTANPDFTGVAGPGRASPNALTSKAGSGSRPGPGARGASAPQSAGASPKSSASAGARPGPSAPGQASPGQAGFRPVTPLPDKTITVAGQPVALRMLTSVALALVPASCGCAGTVRRLLSQAESAGVTVYLVGRRGSRMELTDLALAARTGSPVVAIDAGNALFSAYHPARLAVLLVSSSGAVKVVPNLPAGFHLRSRLRALSPSA